MTDEDSHSWQFRCNVPYTWDGRESLAFKNPTSADTYPWLIFSPEGNDMYSIDLLASHSARFDLKNVETNSEIVSRQTIKDGGRYSFDTGGSTAVVTLTGVDLNYNWGGAVTVSVKRVSDDVQIASKSVGFNVRGCVPYRSVERTGRLWFGGDSVTGSFPDGVYYLQFTYDGTTYYSEPFMWLTSLGYYTHITHRRSSDVVTKNNVIIFDDGEGHVKQFSMYISNIDQKPPYQFDAEVTDIDGRKFAEKQVSYYNKRLAFHCYEAFLEAIRLLWHCDIRYMGSRRIDYMEPPEVNWNNDNHLCDVTLEMSNYDDVMQTNGTASSYSNSADSSHQSYDSSFDESFD